MIRADALVKKYGKFTAVGGVSFEVRPGEILGFLGPNGAGKSTTMKMIAGFLPPTGGTASLGGHDIQKAPLAAKKLLGYLPESGPLYQEMTPREFLLFAAAVRGLTGKAAEAALDRVTAQCHLEGVLHQPIDTLSKGYRQRVGMAQAILHDPPCLIMDEPTDGLDPNQKHEVRKLIAGMGKDKAIILSTHILEEVEAMCTRVIIIALGKVVADDTPAGLLQRHPLARALSVKLAQGPAPETVQHLLGNLSGVKEVQIVGDRYLVLPRGQEKLGELVAGLAREKGWTLDRLEPAPVRLDDVFRNLTQQQRS